MNGSRVGIALVGAALLAGAEPAAAQDVAISLSWGSSNRRASGYYVSEGLRVVGRVEDPYVSPRRVRYVERRHFEECVAEGPYLYCWDAPRYRYAQPVVYVYLTDRHVARRHPRGRAYGWEKRWERQHRALAARHWRRWADDHHYRYDRDRLIVDVAFAW